MIAIALFAAAAATSFDDDRPGMTPAEWYKKPSADDIQAAWPAEAFRHGVSGVARLNCRVNIHGLLEDCRVDVETPPNSGFGPAALLLTPRLTFRPAKTAEGPVPSRVAFSINFRNESQPSTAEGHPTFGYERPPEAMAIQRPEWATAPTFADLAAAYPARAAGVVGYVSMLCGVRTSGATKDCEVVREEPKDKGFAGAAKRLSAKFTVKLRPESLAPKLPRFVDVSVRFLSPDSEAMRAHRIGEPVWLTTIDPARNAQLFPAAAAAKGLRTGRGVAVCTVADDGALAGCHPEREAAEDLGFSDAAVRVASVMRMNRWTQEGGPVDGATISLPIRFNLSAPPPMPESR